MKIYKSITSNRLFMLKHIAFVTPILLLVAISLMLVGCGGSSGSSSGGGGGGGSTPGQAQGVYTGTASNGDTFNSIALPNDQIYADYGTLSGNVLFICGLITGQGVSKSGTYTANVTVFDYCTGSLLVLTGSVNASYVAGSSLNGTLTDSNGTVTFTGTTPADFNYNTPASFSAISGTWTGTLIDGTTAIVSVSSTGSVSGSDSGCTFSGTVTPDSSNKNFFDLSLTFGGSPCAFPNQTATGIAVDYPLSTGLTQLVAAATIGTSAGTVFAAQR